jgi:hypothetical protein
MGSFGIMQLNRIGILLAGSRFNVRLDFGGGYKWSGTKKRSAVAAN